MTFVNTTKTILSKNFFQIGVVDDWDSASLGFAAPQFCAPKGLHVADQLIVIYLVCL